MRAGFAGLTDQLSHLKQDKLRDPRVWAPYILIE
jgi:hypothetical protein